MIFDIDESPLYNEIIIEGRLIFKNDAVALKLNAKKILVKGQGELIIGTEEEPFRGDAWITLYGEKVTANTTETDYTLSPGNKALINTGYVSMFGRERQMLTRLVQEANRSDTVIYVEPGL
jgi:hypothetical protein